MPSTDPIDGGERYELLGELGRGGMGVVYRARDRRSGREVALKVVLSELNDARRSRFQREGELTARLTHPAIVRIYSSGELNGRPFLAYELVEGEALSEALRRADRRQRVEWIAEAARGLGFAHTQGITHRDVKPDNILVGADGQPRVADFGLATACDVERLTRTGTTLGTPTYMSPEQIGGANESVGPTSDTWAMGVILYEALTDRQPFAAAESMVELAGKIISAQVVAPREIDPSVPEDLERICLKALSKAPAARYATGAELAADLQRHLDGEAVDARVERARGAPLVFGVVAAILAIGVLAALVFAPTAESPPEPPRDAPERPSRATRMGGDRQAGVELERLLALQGDPQARHAALERWLFGHAKHAEAARARRARDEAQREFPVWRIETRPYKRWGRRTHARFLDDRRVLTFVATAPLRCWSLDDPSKPLWEIDMRGAYVTDVAIAPGGDAALLGIGGAPPLLLDLGRREASPAEGLTIRFAENLTFSQNGRRLALSSAKDDMAYVYSWPEGKKLFKVERDAIRALALSRNGRRLALCGGGWADKKFSQRSADGDFLEIWDVDSKTRVFQKSYRAPPREVCFSPDERYLVAGDTVGTLFAYELANPQEQIVFRAPQVGGGKGDFMTSVAHSGEIEGLAFLPDGKTLVTSASRRTQEVGDSELKVWSFPAGELLRVVPRPTRPIGLQLSPSKRLLLTGGDGAVEVHLAQR